MNYPIRTFLTALLLILLRLSCPAVHAATVTASSPTNATADYLQNWNNATVSDGTFLLPAASVPDTAIINQGRTIEVTTPVIVNPGAVIVANTSNGQSGSFLNINAGGSLTMSGGNLTVSANNDAGTANLQGGSLTTNSPVDVLAGGTFNLSSGNFTNNGSGSRSIFSDTNGAGGVVNITGGTFTALGAAPNHILRFENDTINISGGTVNASGGQVLLANTTTLSITGDAATIQMDRLNMNTAARAATVNFNFGPTGVSPIQNDAFLHLSNATLNIDGSNYTGGSGTFDLFTAPNVASLSPTVNVTGFGVEGVDYTFLQSTTSNIVQLNVLGPEPATRFARIDLDGGGDNLFNGSFEDITVDIGIAGQNAKVTGTNTSLDVHETNQYTIQNWEPFFSDPNDVLSRYGNSGSVTTNAWYLTTLSSINSGAGNYDGERGILIDSAEGYEHGLVNEDFLSDLDPKFLNPNAQYKLSVDLIRRTDNLPGDANGTATVMVTDSAIDPINSANAIPGGTLTGIIEDLPVGTTKFKLNLSGADLANASQLNLIIKQVNTGVIGVEDVLGQDPDFVSQAVFDNFVLTGYLPGDSDGDFDVDNDDLAAWQAGFGTIRADNTTSHELGDFDTDGEVDDDDYVVWLANFTGSLPLSAATKVPEPSSIALLLSCFSMAYSRIAQLALEF